MQVRGRWGRKAPRGKSLEWFRILEGAVEEFCRDAEEYQLEGGV